LFDQGIRLPVAAQQAYHCARESLHLRVSDTCTDKSVRLTMQLAPKIASDLLAWLTSVHQGAGAITPAHIDGYLDELVFRLHCRHADRPGRSFACLLLSASVTPPTQYRRSRSYKASTPQQQSSCTSEASDSGINLIYFDALFAP
jgi:hypothetical protein